MLFYDVEMQELIKRGACRINNFIKLYNDQRNAQCFNLFINLFLHYIFLAFF
jgi:hypothetical protein